MVRPGQSAASAHPPALSALVAGSARGDEFDGLPSFPSAQGEGHGQDFLQHGKQTADDGL
jgi:hypothetical protein